MRCGVYSKAAFIIKSYFFISDKNYGKSFKKLCKFKGDRRQIVFARNVFSLNCPSVGYFLKCGLVGFGFINLNPTPIVEHLRRRDPKCDDVFYY